MGKRCWRYKSLPQTIAFARMKTLKKKNYIVNENTTRLITIQHNRIPTTASRCRLPHSHQMVELGDGSSPARSSQQQRIVQPNLISSNNKTWYYSYSESATQHTAWQTEHQLLTRSNSSNVVRTEWNIEHCARRITQLAKVINIINSINHSICQTHRWPIRMNLKIQIPCRTNRRQQSKTDEDYLS